jgi:hypothetical protein
MHSLFRPAIAGFAEVDEGGVKLDTLAKLLRKRANALAGLVDTERVRSTGDKPKPTP